MSSGRLALHRLRRRRTRLLFKRPTYGNLRGLFCLWHSALIQVYRDGHQLGLRRYCTAANGYLLGEDGKAISDLCPSDLRPAFLQNYL
ncbi:MAG: DUF2799 domain-containing protein, partial [Porticoccaceae bacterium]|nr:DUF2799 domain-containing protein [Porticoccaceae bacterium]